MIRVLIADDCDTTRKLLRAILATDPEIGVVGEATDARQAVELTTKLEPDLVIMDGHMPRMNGFEATREIMSTEPTPVVIVTGSTSARDVQSSVRALQAGALTVLPKPLGPNSPKFQESARQFVATLKAMAQVKVVRHHRRGSIAARPALATVERNGSPGRIVAIVASTGGPAALAQVLSGLPDDFAAPILVVQHIGQGFTSGLADWLATMCPLGVKLAEVGETLEPHTVYFAPEDRHFGVSRGGMVMLSSEPPIGGFRPSGTFLFESVALAFGRATVAVILTGMGTDGVDGLRAVRRAGGHIIAQDESSSVVFGMPGAAVTAGLADLVLPLDRIASRLHAIVGTDGARRAAVADVPAGSQGAWTALDVASDLCSATADN